MVSVQTSAPVSHAALSQGRQRGPPFAVEEAYAARVRCYILFHGERHPAEMGAPGVTRFLSPLAADGRVAASTQNRPLSALLFLYLQIQPDRQDARRVTGRMSPARARATYRNRPTG